MINVRNAPERKAETALKEKPIMTQPIASDPNMTARPTHAKATRLISSIGRLGNKGGPWASHPTLANHIKAKALTEPIRDQANPSVAIRRPLRWDAHA